MTGRRDPYRADKRAAADADAALWRGAYYDGLDAYGRPIPYPGATAPDEMAANRGAPLVIPTGLLGQPDCPLCGGDGWIRRPVEEPAPGPRGTTTTRTVERSERCTCQGAR